MKKAISIIILIFLLAPCRLFAAGACCDNAIYAQTAPANRPDWVITEICPDQAGDGTGGWSDGKDCMEFIEIYNNSGTTLNLYDYCLTYNGNARTSEKFETQIVEITPFKPGDYLDGTTMPWSGQSIECGDLSNKPVNPETCLVAPGEIVVLWVMYHEAYYALWNDGKGMSIDDFRNFWNIPEGVKVIAVDGNSNTNYGGHDKNFNVKNSATGTYGIALYSEALNTAANTATGGDANYPVVYTESPELICWATVCFTTQLLAGSIANYSYNFTVDTQGYGAEEFGYVHDLRRMALIYPYSDAKNEATVGRLLPIQKLTLGVPLEAGETCELTDDIYIPEIGKTFLGFEIDGTFYELGSTFTAPAAGVYTLQFKYGDADETTTTTEPPKDTTTAPKETTTEAPEDTSAPSEEDTTTAPPAEEPKKEGCKSAMGLGFVALLVPAALVIAKKKRL